MLDDDGKSAPKKISLNWEKDVIYLPFTSTSGGSMGIMHTHKSLLSSFYSPDNAANHWIDQAIGESIACGNWFFHMTGLYSVALSAIYGISLYTLSEYSNEAFVEMIVDNKIGTATVYPWQVKNNLYNLQHYIALLKVEHIVCNIQLFLKFLDSVPLSVT